jgi:CubicO group peptidase (beta-lactamase class C family)
MTPEKLEADVAQVAQLGKVAAVGLAMYHQGQIHAIVKGVRKQGVPTPVSQNDRFIVVLNSCLLTMVLIGRLVDRGVLRWDQTVAEIFPEYRGYINPGNEDTTIEMFATLRSGITEHVYKGDGGRIYQYLISPTTDGPTGRRAQALYSLNRPPDENPGSKECWTGTNILILAFIAESVTGQTYEDLLVNEVLRPLNMLQSGFSQPDAERNERSPEPVQPWPHYCEEANPVAAVPDNPTANHLIRRATHPLVGVHMTIADAARFCKFCIDGLDAAGAPLLAQDTFDKMFRPSPSERLAWTCGHLAVTDRDWGGGGRVLTLQGNDLGFASDIWIAPSAGKAFISVTNCMGNLGTSMSNEVASLAASY